MMTGSEFYLDRSLTSLIERICESYEKDIAISDEVLEISYEQLWALVNALSSQLNEMSLGGAIICIALPGSIKYVISILSILNVRGVFAPIDLSWPDERIISVLEITQPSAMIIEKSMFSRIENILNRLKYNYTSCESISAGVYVINIEGHVCFRNDPHAHWAEDSLYLLCTSGSTGVPNVVEGKHLSLLHFIKWQISKFNIDRKCRVALLAPTTFDVSLRDIFLPLCSGGKLFIPRLNERYSPVYFPAWIRKNEISIIHSVPTVFKTAISLIRINEKIRDALESVEYLFLSGEKLFSADAKSFYELMSVGAKIVNFYGPSESTLIKTYYEVPRDGLKFDMGLVPIGSAISGCEVSVNAESGNEGEIVITSRFLARGYFNNEILNKKKFIPLEKGKSDEVSYLTGDIGYFDGGGILHFLGRNDTQVKVAGNRIELNEIESCLKNMQGIEDVTVLACDSDKGHGDPKIVCVYKSTMTIGEIEIREYLRRRIPGYMLPSKIVKIAEFPLLASGKKDRRKLLEMMRSNSMEIN